MLALQQAQKPNVHLAVVPTQPVLNPDIDTLLKVCASNVALQRGDTALALQHAKAACISKGSPESKFAASFQLARCYFATQNFTLLRVEARRCRQNLAPDDLLGHFKMCELETKSGLQIDLQNSSFERAIGLNAAAPMQVWNSLLHYTRAQALLQMGDYTSAEKAAGQACAAHQDCAPLHLFHGTRSASRSCYIFMKLMPNALPTFITSPYVCDVGAICLALSNTTPAIRSLSKAAKGGPAEISVAGVLLAQIESIKSKGPSRSAYKWIQQSWKSWPAGISSTDT